VEPKTYCAGAGLVNPLDAGTLCLSRRTPAGKQSQARVNSGFVGRETGKQIPSLSQYVGGTNDLNPGFETNVPTGVKRTRGGKKSRWEKKGKEINL